MHGVLWYLLTGLLIEGALGSFQYYTNRDVMKKEKKMDRRRFVMRMSPVVPIVFFVCVLFCGGCIVIGLVTENETFTLWVFLLFATFFLLSLYLFLAALMARYAVDEEKIVSVRLFHRRKIIPFTEITRATMENRGEIGGRCLYLYSGKQRVAKIESAAVGFDLLISLLREKKIFCMEFGTGVF